MNIARRSITRSMSTDNGFSSSMSRLISQLDTLAPRFEMEKDQIQILTEPKQFYQTLKSKISKAENRVFLSSLYIGKTEHDLIDCISLALKKNPNLKVHVLTDALRGTREAPSKSSASLLAELIKQYGTERVDIRMFHTPNLNGLNKKIIPKRFNEGFGLQHMKIYGFDNEVILSGANLSSDYFTNRQDRYYVFKSSSLADFYHNIQKTIGLLSYKVNYSENKSNFTLLWPDSNLAPEPITDLKGYIKCSTNALKPIFSGENFNLTSLKTSSASTYVYPVSQFTPLLNPDISTERPSITKLLEYSNNKNIKWSFTAGYFNMLPDIKKGLLQNCSKGNVITASPHANGFFESKGVSKYLPDAYLYLSKMFLKDVKEFDRENDITLLEWKKGIVNQENGWSYHAKGFWMTAPNEIKPSITIIGSSNYTRRAYSFDLETNAIIITKDEDLKNEMNKELLNIMQNTKPVTLEDFDHEDRKISKGVILATKILGKRL